MEHDLLQRLAAYESQVCLCTASSSDYSSTAQGLSAELLWQVSQQPSFTEAHGQVLVSTALWEKARLRFCLPEAIPQDGRQPESEVRSTWAQPSCRAVLSGSCCVPGGGTVASSLSSAQRAAPS